MVCGSGAPHFYVCEGVSEHNEGAIIQSLRLDLMVTTDISRTIDQLELRRIMDSTVNGGILSDPFDFCTIADAPFSTQFIERTGYVRPATNQDQE